MPFVPKNDELSLSSLGIQMPYNMQAEQSVLGAALMEDTILNRLITEMEPEMFYSEQNRAVFETMRALFTDSEAVDVITLVNALGTNGTFAGADDAKVYITRIAETVPAISNVDSYIKIVKEKYQARRLIDAGIGNANGDPESLLRHAGEALAYLTQCAAVMTTPSGENTKIKRVELVPISPHTAMIVLLASNGILRSKLFRLDSAIDTTICETFYNVAQAMLIGVPVSSLTPAYLQSIAARLGMESLAMFPMLSAVAELSQSAAQPHVFLSGQSNLLHHREYAGRAYELLEFLSRGTPLRTLADSMKGELEIRIGRENGFVQLDNSSIILARYTVGEDSSGSIGIIGPTRMDYRRLVPGLKYISQCISKTMEKALEE